jgi:hypothetical protein
VNLGVPAGLGVRAGASFIPELGVEGHAGTAVFWNDYGVDLVYRPIARRYNVTPTLRVGLDVIQNTFEYSSLPRWLPTPTAAVGVEWRAPCGFMLAAQGGIGVRVEPEHNGVPLGASIIPNVNRILNGECRSRVGRTNRRDL